MASSLILYLHSLLPLFIFTLLPGKSEGCGSLAQYAVSNRAQIFKPHIFTDPGNRNQDPFPGVEETKTMISNLVGPFSKNGIQELDGGRLAVESGSDLNCDFSAECCWHNIQGGSDDLDWVLVKDPVNVSKASRVFRNPPSLPVAPFVATGAGQSHSLVYSFLVSCPIICQHGPAFLNFQHWKSEDVMIDVCVLPLESRRFSYCQPFGPRSPLAINATIPAQDSPFVIVLIASEFTQKTGGIAAIDTIRYSGNVCSAFKSPDKGYTATTKRTTTQTPPPFPFKETDPVGGGIGKGSLSGTKAYKEVCSALFCHSSADNCGFSPLSDPGIKEYTARTAKLGNYASGVPFSSINHEYYIGATLSMGDIAGMKTPEFRLDSPVRLLFDFFEAAFDVEMVVCHNPIESGDGCKPVSQRGVADSDRRWRRAHIDIPPGPRRQIVFLARNYGDNEASVGIAGLKILSPNTLTTICDVERFYEFDSPLFRDVLGVFDSAYS